MADDHALALGQLISPSPRLRGYGQPVVRIPSPVLIESTTA
jgi:hypothetical protein